MYAAKCLIKFRGFSFLSFMMILLVVCDSSQNAEEESKFARGRVDYCVCVCLLFFLSSTGTFKKTAREEFAL